MVALTSIRTGRGGRHLRIGYGRLFHEANAYSPLPTVREHFTDFHHVTGDELHRATELGGVELRSFMPHAELTGFRQAARLAGDVEAVPLQSSMAVPGGSLTLECFEQLVDELIGRIEAAGHLDGVYLALHGSMQVTGLTRPPEAVVIERVREKIGFRAGLAVSYDLHANLSTGLVDPVDVLIAYRTNPHWDLAPTGFRAGNRLIRALRGQCRPVHAWRKLPLVLGGGTTIDFLSPMRGVFRALRRLEDDPRVLSASLFMVHPYTTAERLGWAVHVSTDGDPALAAELAERLADQAWAERDVPMPELRTVEQALDEVAASPWRRLGPATLIDVDDIVGAGAPGGNTRIIAAMAANPRGLRGYIPVHDPALVAEVAGDAPGTRRALTLRGTPGYHSPAVTLDAVVAAQTTGDFGRTVRLDVGPMHVVVTERPPLPIHPSFWTAVGLNPREADFLVQKNFFHYRLFYATTSFRHIPVASDGATSLVRVRERSAAAGVHPGVRPRDWRSHDAALRG